MSNVSARLQPARKPVDRRRHQRVEVSLLGRYMLEDRREFPCQTLNISPGGAAIAAPVRGEIGERVIAYFEQIGRVEGAIVRYLDRGFAMAFNLATVKQEKIAENLTWLVNRDALGMPEDRRHERILPNRKHAILQIDGDREHVVRLIDISISGAAIATAVKIPIGTRVVLGQMPGKIVRLFEEGLAVNFDATIPIERFDENIVL